jgi:hypothetical protein
MKDCQKSRHPTTTGKIESVFVSVCDPPLQLQNAQPEAGRKIVKLWTKP